MTVDSKHSSLLSNLHSNAQKGNTVVANWALKANTDPEEVHADIMDKLGSLKVKPAWEVFAKIYNEDTPDIVFTDIRDFATTLLTSNNIKKTDLIVDAACGTGALSRLLTLEGYKNIIAFDRSRAMLSEAFKLNSHLTSIQIQEADIADIKLHQQAKAIIWVDFSSNFALSEGDLKKWLLNLVQNIETNGILLFDVRTITGWNVDFFKQKVTIYETDNFQRIWINKPDYEKKLITFDIFIRVKDKAGNWQEWEREQMTERMWTLDEVATIVKSIHEIQMKSVYNEDFSSWTEGQNEPGLAYFVVQKFK